MRRVREFVFVGLGQVLGERLGVVVTKQRLKILNGNSKMGLYFRVIDEEIKVSGIEP